MLISPPFLPNRADDLSDAQWLELAMQGGVPGQGGYPVSFNLGWHGGIHLEAPSSGNSRLPVCAIADGTVVYVRKPTEWPCPMQEDHPLNYRGGWTSDGCVVIKHETEIGANAEDTATQVTFYSITMHLHEIHKKIKQGKKIYRKDEVGQAGHIYGDPNKIHFEIICDDKNLALLIGRAEGDLDTSKDGRTDSVYGELYFKLPEWAEIYTTQPAANVVTPDEPSMHTLGKPMYVGIRYAAGDGEPGRRGDAYITTYQEDGEIVGASVKEDEAEYKLYASATKISDAYRAANAKPNATQAPVPAPSAVYELLHFGRVIGPDALNPANTPHWRKICFGEGYGWVNLNAPGVMKFSDADFPHWKDWKLIDDSKDLDSRCDSKTIKGWLDEDQDGKVDPNEAVSLLSEDHIQAKMRHTICKLPTEWEKATVDHRWGWLKEESEENPAPLSDADFLKLREHIEELAFWEEAGIGISTNHWHFQPREFIRQFRMCGWMSSSELDHSLAAAPAAGRVRAEALRLLMNKMMRKFSIHTGRLRSAHFLAQVGHETGWWQYREELGNERYFRTMYEIITVQEAAEDYRSGLAQRLNLVQRGESEQGYAARRPGVVAAKAATMDNGAANASHGGQTGDGPRFRGRGFLQITGRRNYIGYGAFRGRDFLTDPNPRLLATDDFNACDASGFYWARERANIEADAGSEARNVTRVGGVVNRGSAARVPLHDRERQNVFTAIWERLNDDV